MKQQIYFIYDDSERPPFSIETIVGDRSFGHIIHKRTKLRDKLRLQLKKEGIEEIFEITHPQQRTEMINQFKEESNTPIFIHYFSKAVIVDPEKFSILLNKIIYSHSTSINQENDPFMLVFTNISKYEEYIKLLNKNHIITRADLGSETLMFAPNNFAMDISNIAAFLNFFSGGFEARYFNELVGDELILVKKSSDKQKMEKEYTYYHLLPDVMKKWYVMPYDFKAEKDYASYTMERLNVPDMALQWIHNSVSIRDMETFLNKIFSFIASRPVRKIERTEYMQRFNDLYYQKVLDRMNNLKELAPFSALNSYVVNGTTYSLEQIISDYHEIFLQFEGELSVYTEVIGHGDLCFSNILYDKNSYMMKFIDTKGALKEKDLWTDPYYDLAKLSHSILGNYDFINNELFIISLNNSLSLQLSLKSRLLTPFQQLFIKKVEEAGYDIKLIRLCEASLFLSMLPLHIDNPRKVLAFLLNAIQIKEELEQNV
ncbi:hypothetical protein [Paenibacillus camerounensis]|uniref:hypothetical protein n=1 Tax=Paenibacillus camerounensis TaxID=1243663 RepID=UPI000694A1B6|nr:hypothetical protein [Paenibacillus camerounensis]